MSFKRTAFIPLLITYGIVNAVHYLVGFDYDILSEGILNLKFLIDVASWAIVYLAVYFLFRKWQSSKGAAAD